MASVAAFGTLARVSYGLGTVVTGVLGAGALTMAVQTAKLVKSSGSFPGLTSEENKIVNSYRTLGGIGFAAFGVSMCYAASLMGRVAIWGTGVLALKMPLFIAAISMIALLYIGDKAHSLMDKSKAVKKASLNPTPSLPRTNPSFHGQLDDLSEPLS